MQQSPTPSTAKLNHQPLVARKRIIRQLLEGIREPVAEKRQVKPFPNHLYVSNKCPKISTSSSDALHYCRWRHRMNASPISTTLSPSWKRSQRTVNTLATGRFGGLRLLSATSTDQRWGMFLKKCFNLFVDKPSIGLFWASKIITPFSLSSGLGHQDHPSLIIHIPRMDLSGSSSKPTLRLHRFKTDTICIRYIALFALQADILG